MIRKQIIARVRSYTPWQNLRDHGEWGCERECRTVLDESVVADCIKMVISEQSMGSVAGDSGPGRVSA